MLIVTKGKVDGVAAGGVLDGLTPEKEKWLVSLGVAAYPGRDEAGPTAAPAAAPVKAPSGTTKAELQAHCRELGLSDKGSKADLQARIDSAMAEPEAEAGDDDEFPDLEAEVPR